VSEVWGRLRQLLLEPRWPLAAIEVRSAGIGVVRLTKDGGRSKLAAAAALELPAGALVASMTQDNLADPEVFKRTLRAALEKAGALDTSAVGLVLPDSVARIALLPSAEMKASGRAEAEELLRFRMRKSVPFDIRDARLAFRPGEPNWLVAAIARSVLEEYEAACASVGLNVGLVELSGLALLGSIERRQGAGDRLVVNWDDDYVSFLVSGGGQVSVVRTLSGAGVATPENVAREAAQTLLYYRDRLQGPGLAAASVRATVLPAAEAAACLAEPLGVVPEPLDPWGPLGASVDGLSGQALAGAAASLLGRAA
jgi:hypothetical protein